MTPRFAVLLMGDASSDVMRPAVHALTAKSPELSVRRLKNVDAAAQLADKEGWQADLCVACQHWSDEFTTGEVARLLRLFPLARFVCVYGPWCASDGRTRDAWPLSVRVPAHSAPDRIQRELGVLRGEIPPLPLTASRDEIFEFDRCERAAAQSPPTWT